MKRIKALAQLQAVAIAAQVNVVGEVVTCDAKPVSSEDQNISLDCDDLLVATLFHSHQATHGQDHSQDLPPNEPLSLQSRYRRVPFTMQSVCVGIT